MQTSVVRTELADPMHLRDWEEQDEPLATDYHFDEQTYCFLALRHLLNPVGHYVAMDRWLRLDPTNTEKVQPDILVALDVFPRQWGVNEYRPWEVGKPPEFLIEFLSPSSEEADQHDKPDTYALLGVREYVLIDPDGTFGVPRIQGWHLAGTTWVPLPAAPDDGVESIVLPVRLALIGGHIVVFDRRTGEQVLSFEEALVMYHLETMARMRAEEQARLEAERADREAERARAEAERATREVEQARAEADRADREADRARQAEAEVARLRAELNRIRGQG